MSTLEIMLMADTYADRFYLDRKYHNEESYYDRAASRACLQATIEALEAENLGLRLECQGLKAEVAEVKSYWKEAARKNAEMLAREANRLGGGL